MNPRELRRNMNVMLRSRLKKMALMVVAGKWGTRAAGFQEFNGKKLDMLEVVDIKTGISQLRMPVDFFEKTMQRSGYRRDKGEGKK